MEGTSVGRNGDREKQVGVRRKEELEKQMKHGRRMANEQWHEMEMSVVHGGRIRKEQVCVVTGKRIRRPLRVALRSISHISHRESSAQAS